ncbi:hypothetical protein PIB30_113080, partial [Stylosanthes scabra]|nr:hypothetical protein [Stylosanthes scabra]
SDKVTIIIDKPSSFPYQDNHTVPWKYDPKIAIKGLVPPLNEIFDTPKKLSIAQYVIHQDTIHSLDGEGDEIKDAIRRAKEDEALLNWTSEPIIDICVS